MSTPKSKVNSKTKTESEVEEDGSGEDAEETTATRKVSGKKRYSKEEIDEIRAKKNDPAYIREKTENYFVLSPNYYHRIYSGDNIRYMADDGNVNDGGFVLGTIKLDGGDVALRLSKFRNYSTKAHTWLVKISNTKTIWKRLPIEVILLRQSIDRMNDRMGNMAEFLMMKYGDEFRDFMKKKGAERS